MHQLKRGFKSILFAFAVNLIWTFFISILFGYLGSSNFIHSSYQFEKEPLRSTIFWSCIFAPLWEEAVFRHFPLMVISSLRKKARRKLLIPTIILTSIIFGLLHDGVPSILIQGFGGLMLSYVYLTNKKQGYIWAVASHALWNTAMLVISFH